MTVVEPVELVQSAPQPQQSVPMCEEPANTCTTTEQESSKSSCCSSDRAKSALTTVAALFIILTNHAFTGISPVLVRYMQTVSGLPSFSINAFANGITVMVYTPFIIIGACVSYRNSYCTKSEQFAAVEAVNRPVEEVLTNDKIIIESPCNGDNKEQAIVMFHCNDQTNFIHVDVHCSLRIQSQQQNSFNSSSSSLVTNETHSQAELLPKGNGSNTLHVTTVLPDNSRSRSTSDATTVSSTSDLSTEEDSGAAIAIQLQAKTLSQSFTIYSALDILLTIVITGAIVIVFIVCRVGKSICNLLAAKFTASINTQLVALSSPFMVTGIMLTGSSIYACCMRGSGKLIQIPFNLKMAIAMIISSVGAILIVFGRFSSDPSEFTWTINFAKFASATSDFAVAFLGIIISLVGNFLGAWYTVLLSLLTSTSANQPKFLTRYNKFRLGWFQLTYFQAWVVFIFCLALSFILQENWNAWRNLSYQGWIVFAVYTAFVYIVCEIFNVLGTQMLGSITASALMPTSLIATIAVASFLLNELVNNLWQIIGCVVVLFGVTLFILFRNLLTAQQAKAMKKWESEHAEKVTLDQAAKV